MKKPRLGTTVYCIYGDGIFKDTVGYLGKDSFVLESINNPISERDSLIWEFDKYDIEWFTSIAKAKKGLIDQFKDDYENKLKVTKMEDTWWQLEYC